ncbi:LOW QUALITY PROTEIN: hypothetical protein AAY473_037091 [Plecturocebus cupreus]
MGATLPKAKSPLKDILDNWDQFDPQSWKKNVAVSLCQVEKPGLLREVSVTTPSTIRPFLEGKRIEVLCVQLFSSLRGNPQLCKACFLCPPGPSSGPPPHPGLPAAPPSTDTDQAIGGESGPSKLHTLFPLSDLKQIKVDLGKFSDKCIDVLQERGCSSSSSSLGTPDTLVKYMTKQRQRRTDFLKVDRQSLAWTLAGILTQNRGTGVVGTY